MLLTKLQMTMFAVLTVAVLNPSINLEAQVTGAPADSGAFLYQSCQTFLKTIDDSYFKPSPRETANALMCDTYVQGFTDGMIGSSHDFCAVKVAREQAIRKYVAYMTENPLFLKEDKLIGVALVLQPLYRCPSKKESKIR